MSKEMTFKLSRGPKDTAKDAEAPLGLSKEQYEVIQKPTSRTTPEVTDKIEAPTGKLPAGYVWVWNRLGRVNERKLDNKLQSWEPYEFKVYPEDIAKWLVQHSQIVGGVGPEHNLGGINSLAVETSKDWCKPLGDYKPAEFINRAADPNPIGRGTGGIKTRPVLMDIASTVHPEDH